MDDHSPHTCEHPTLQNHFRPTNSDIHREGLWCLKPVYSTVGEKKTTGRRIPLHTEHVNYLVGPFQLLNSLLGLHNRTIVFYLSRSKSKSSKEWHTPFVHKKCMLYTTEGWYGVLISTRQQRLTTTWESWSRKIHQSINNNALVTNIYILLHEAEHCYECFNFTKHCERKLVLHVYL